MSNLAWTIYESPLGALTVVAGAGGVRSVYFPDRSPRPRLDDSHRRPLPRAAEQLDEYFAGERRAFELDLDLRGEPLQRAVWQQLREIPYGETTSYGELAGRIDDLLYPRGLEPYKRVRLAAAAVGRTPTPILVPCHRVIGADGSLTGYGGGLHRKRALLDLESGVLSRVSADLPGELFSEVGMILGMAATAPTLDELTVAGSAAAWRDCGFEVAGDTCVVGETRIRLAGSDAGRGLSRWSLRDVASDAELDGLPTSPSGRPPPAGPRAPHPNGVTGLDHVVAITPDLGRTVRALEAAGLDLRRIREEPTPAGPPRQAFFRLAEVILEVVQEPPEAIERGGGTDRAAFFWGLAFVAPDLEATVAFLGSDRAGEVRAAVQPGRRIATLRRAAGLALPVALITPRPAR